MIFVKRIAFCLALTIAATGRAEGLEFRVSSVELSAQDQAEGGEVLIARLKHRAVAHYLQRQLGARYGQFERSITPNFTEQYILDYRVSRPTGNKTAVELTGHLDADALKRWLRVAAVKSSGSDRMKPYFIFSSTIPGLSFSPGETATKLSGSTVAQTAFSMLGAQFQKLNAKLGLIAGLNLSLSQPPRNPSDIRALQDAGQPGGYTSAVWLHLSPCQSCGGAKLESAFYNLSQGRVSVFRSDDVALDAQDFASVDKVRKALKEPLQEFQSEFDEFLSQGTLLSGAYRLQVEGIDSYRAFRQIDTGLGKLDFLTRSILKRSEPGMAEFEILSSFGAEEVLQRFHLASFPGFSLKPVRVDSGAIIVRYLSK